VNQYLYAIVDRLPSGWRPPAAGVGSTAVVSRRIDNVTLVGSLIETVPSANPRTLALHQDVVATVIDAPAILPFRYGTAMAAAQLADWLATRRALVRAALGAVHGCVEMTVKLLRLDCAFTHPLAEDGRVRRPGEAPLGPGERELRGLAEALAERAALSQWRYQPSGSAGNVTASVAFLVPRVGLEGFLARIAPVASHAIGVAVVPTGPWAPYSFVPELDSISSAGARREAPPSVRRRVS
jgi:hypothetical protein